MKLLKNIFLCSAAFVQIAAYSAEENDVARVPKVLNEGKIAAGPGRTCAVKTNGTVACWGDNTFGQLGDGATGGVRFAPKVVMGLTDVSSIAAGMGHTCAVKTNGTVVCWGDNVFGQLGDGTREERRTSVMVRGMTGVSTIAAGMGHTCAVKTNGTVACWGSNLHGQLGNGGKYIEPRTPVVVPRLTDIVSIAAGNAHTCAVKTNGTVACWGSNLHGQLGDGTIQIQNTPVAVFGLTDVSSIAAGTFHTCALKTNGAIACWGNNSSGQLGINTDDKNRYVPAAVSGLTDVSSIAVGDFHTCAVKTNGTVACWGENNSGQLGDGTIAEVRLAPKIVLGLTGVSSIAAGTFHTCALKTNGIVDCWGANALGQLGDGTEVTRLTPTRALFSPN